MAVKTADIRHEGGMRFVARTGSGFEIAMDDQAGGTAPTPTELLVAAIGGCTAMDVVSILQKKRQNVTGYALRVEGIQRSAHPHAFRQVQVVHEVTGPAVDVEAVRRSIELSATKYCAVSTGLASGYAELHHRYAVISPAGSAPIEGEAAVTGPGLEMPPDDER
jgi:putative redox protein